MLTKVYYTIAIPWEDSYDALTDSFKKADLSTADHTNNYYSPYQFYA